MSAEQVNTFLSWAAPGNSLVIRLDSGVIDRMNIDIMRGFGVTRRRGTETGGVLIGKIDHRVSPPVLQIQDFEVCPCEYASGPSYVLSTTDRTRFREAVTRRQPSLDRDSYAVGYFRSHTRDGFALDESDVALFREFFHDPLDVALLIKPYATRVADAGFFLQDKGILVANESPIQFSFTSRQTTQSEIAVEPSPRKFEAPPPPPTAPQPRPQVSATRPFGRPVPERPMFEQPLSEPSGLKRAFSWTAFSLALLAFGGVCGYEYAGARLEQQRAAAISSGQISPGISLPPGDLYTAQLQASQADRNVMVKWDRNSAPIQAAIRGVLTITEGSNSKEVKLGFAELRNGTALYPISGPQVRFRLELFFNDNRSFVEATEFRAR